MFCSIKSFEELTNTELYEIIKARFNVFYIEQRCFYPDLDDIDYDSIHLFMQDGREVIAYARLFPEATPGVWHVGRVLTTRRNEGLGRKLMQSVMETAWKQGAVKLCMEAQVQAKGFYEKLGFTVTSEEFEEAGIPHVRMEMTKCLGN